MINIRTNGRYSYKQMINLLSIDCWWSGCQPMNWAERGCFPANEYKQTGSEKCSDGGDKYLCCPNKGGGTPPGKGIYYCDE